MSWFFRRRNDREKVDDSTFLKNGAMLLEKLITSFNGKRNPFRSFSAEELNLATIDYDEEKVISRDYGYNLFKAFLKRPVVVMKYAKGPKSYEECINNIAFSSQVCHKNFLKLIGCCLETEIPVLVFESVKYGALVDHIYNSQPHSAPLLFKQRLKIAMEVSDAVTYLHIGLTKPIIHRDIKLSNILLDEQYVAKLFDFSLAEAIPEGETHLKDACIAGTAGYIAPEYFTRLSDINEKSDVYSLGVLLLEILTGKRIHDLARLIDITVWDYEKKHFDTDIIDPIIVAEGSYPGKDQQLEAFLQLIFKCIQRSPEDRPEMIHVAKQLKQIYLSAA